MLTDLERRQLRDFILAGLSQTEFEGILVTNLDREPARITTSLDYAQLVDATLEKAEREDWTKNLLSALTHDRDDTDVGRFASELVYQYLGPDGLQTLLDPIDAMFEWTLWERRMPVIARHVCLVEIGMAAAGTGLLVGPDLILTAQHVVDPLMAGGSAKPGVHGQLSVLFDFVAPPGAPGPQPRRVMAAADWLLESSPMHPLEVARLPPPDDGPVNELDYALLRIDTIVGDAARGWSPLRPPQLPVNQFHAISISQYPAGQPLKGSIGRVTALPRNNARLRYTANSAKVSSGAPCWSVRMDLIALHNFGGVVTPKGKENQGVPIERIIEDISRKRGVLAIPPAPAAPPPAGVVPAVASEVAKRMWTIGAEYPVLDRILLQRALGGVIDANGSQLLSIHGARGTGRSFSASIAQHMLRPLGHLAIVIPAVKLLNTKTADEFLQELRGYLVLTPAQPKVGADLTTRPGEVKRHLVSGFFDDLRKKYPAQGNGPVPAQQVWLFLDGLDQVTLAEETHEMLAEIVTRLPEVPVLRMVLIAYDRDLPEQAENSAQTEAIAPLEKTDIRSHLLHMCEVHNVLLPEPTLMDLVEQVWQAGANGDSLDLRKVAFAVKALDAKIAAMGGT